MHIPVLLRTLGRGTLLGLGLGLVTPAVATDYYIATDGSDVSDGLTRATAWATMAKAMSVAGPGDVVIVRDGIYTERCNITGSGTSQADLVIKAEHPLGAVIDAKDKAYAFFITGNHVKVEGFKACNASMAGITIHATHHVTVTHCESFHHKGAGIYGGGSDYLDIERNHVYDNAWGEKIVTSGISIHLPVNRTGDTQTTTPRINIRWNVVHDNYQVAKTITDGADIILDDLRCAASPKGKVYEFPALVEGNLTYHNGGPGIKLYSSRNLIVRNNTAFKNGRRSAKTTTWGSEIQIINCDNVEVVNNIAAHDLLNPEFHAVANLVQKNVTYTGANQNIVWKNNLLYNYAGSAGTKTNFPEASVPTAGAPDNNKFDQAPDFVAVADESPAADFNFRLTANSPAHDAGTIALGYAPKDLDNAARPRGSTIDVGCYEYGER